LGLVLETESYPIWVNKKLFIPWWRGDEHDYREMVISWDPNKTRITSAKLIVAARANSRTNLRFSVNMHEVVYLRWEVWEDQATKTAEEDVTSLLANGTNIFTVDFWKDLAHPFDVTATFTVTLIVEYEGSSPKVRERTWLEKYWMYIVGGIATVILGGLAIAYAWRKVR